MGPAGPSWLPWSRPEGGRGWVNWQLAARALPGDRALDLPAGSTRPEPAPGSQCRSLGAMASGPQASHFSREMNSSKVGGRDSQGKSFHSELMHYLSMVRTKGSLGNIKSQSTGSAWVTRFSVGLETWMPIFPQPQPRTITSSLECPMVAFGKGQEGAVASSACFAVLSLYLVFPAGGSQGQGLP